MTNPEKHTVQPGPQQHFDQVIGMQGYAPRDAENEGHTFNLVPIPRSDGSTEFWMPHGEIVNPKTQERNIHVIQFDDKGELSGSKLFPVSVLDQTAEKVAKNKQPMEIHRPRAEVIDRPPYQEPAFDRRLTAAEADDLRKEYLRIYGPDTALGVVAHQAVQAVIIDFVPGVTRRPAPTEDVTSDPSPISPEVAPAYEIYVSSLRSRAENIGRGSDDRAVMNYLAGTAWQAQRQAGLPENIKNIFLQVHEIAKNAHPDDASLRAAANTIKNLLRTI